jgi:hypothetical protein
VLGEAFISNSMRDLPCEHKQSEGADNIDEYLETVSKRGDHFVYRYGNAERPVTEEKAVVRYRAAGEMGVAQLSGVSLASPAKPRSCFNDHWRIAIRTSSS